MRLLMVLLFTWAIHVNGWGQVDSVLLIDETFNLPPELDGDYESINLGMEFLSSLTYNGTPVARTTSSNSGSTYLWFKGVPVLNFDSLKVSLYSRANETGSASAAIDHKLYISLDSINYFQTYEFSDVPFNWTHYTYIWNNPFDEYPVEKVYYKLMLDRYNSSTISYIEDFQIIGYISEPIIEEPQSCDTVYVEQPPIILYETDLPQECLLDSDGDGAIGVSDLMNFLLYFGNATPCTIVN